MQKQNILSNFWLKIIAIVTMTLDHIGLMLSENITMPNDPIVVVFRGLGRLALPLFCFMIVEGVLHTKNFKKYILRLSISLLLVSTALIALKNIPQLGFESASTFGNIFIDLTLGAIGVYCLKHKKIYIKLLAILPLAYAITSFFVTSISYADNMTIHWFPYFIQTQYGWYGVVLIYGFYIGHVICDQYLKWHAEKINMSYDLLKDTYIERVAKNLVSVIVLVGLTALFAININMMETGFVDNQIIAVFSGAFILLYNGKRGYNSKYFEYGCYVYYPLHIVIIAAIFYVITL